MGMFQPGGFRWRRGSNDTPTPTDRRSAEPSTQSSIHFEDAPVWVIYASETGVTEDFADDACRQLKKIGRSSRLLPLDALDELTLANVDQALFLASTCDDGDPPFMAEAFYRQRMQRPACLPKLQYGLLALGDRRYDDFCAFGRQLDQWLRFSGAHPLFEAVLMDNEDASAERQWHEGLRMLAAQVARSEGANA